jgi:hypothetical protein
MTASFRGTSHKCGYAAGPEATCAVTVALTLYIGGIFFFITLTSKIFIIFFSEPEKARI